MKTLFIMILVVSSSFGEYQSGKIDMHGGQENYQYGNKKSTFGKSSMGMSLFLDKNTTKKTTWMKKRSKRNSYSPTSQ